MEKTKNNLLEQLAIFYYRKWLVIIPVLIGTVIGFIVSLNISETYSSSTLILLEDQQVPEQYVMPTDKTPFGHRLNAISQQILSRSRLQEIIKKFNLYQNAPGPLDKLLMLKFKLLNPRTGDGGEFEAATQQMRKDIEFKVAGDELKRGPGASGNAFTISYTGTDPKVTKQVTEKLASLFIEENLKSREQNAQGTSEFLSNELDKAKLELEKQEKNLKEFRSSHMGSLPQQLEANLRTLDRMQLDVQTTNEAIKNNEDRLVVLEKMIEVTPAARESGIGTPSAELEKLRDELSVLLSRYKENYPDVIITKKRINELEKQLERRNKEMISESSEKAGVRNPAVYAEYMSVKSQIKTLRQREAEIKRRMRQYEERVESTPTNEQRESDLLRDYKISLQNYQTLLEKKLSARLAENLEKKQKGEKFKIIDHANLPQKPIGPDKAKITAGGTMGGALAGVGMIFVFEMLNPAFRKPEDFEGVLDAPVLTTIPIISTDRKPAQGLKLVKGRK